MHSTSPTALHIWKVNSVLILSANTHAGPKARVERFESSVKNLPLPVQNVPQPFLTVTPGRRVISTNRSVVRLLYDATHWARRWPTPKYSRSRASLGFSREGVAPPLKLVHRQNLDGPL